MSPLASFFIGAKIYSFKLLLAISAYKWLFITTFIASLFTGSGILEIALLILMLLDWLTGLYKAIKTKSFKSTKVGHSLEKFLFYFIVFIAAGLVDVSIGAIICTPSFAVRYIVASVMFTREFTSILENSNIILGGEMIKEIKEKVLEYFKKK